MWKILQYSNSIRGSCQNITILWFDQGARQMITVIWFLRGCKSKWLQYYYSREGVKPIITVDYI